MSDDDLSYELNSLAAQNVATRTILVELLKRMIIRPDMEHAIIDSFNEAADIVENMTIRFGKHASPAHLLKALEIVLSRCAPW